MTLLQGARRCHCHCQSVEGVAIAVRVSAGAHPLNEPLVKFVQICPAARGASTSRSFMIQQKRPSHGGTLVPDGGPCQDGGRTERQQSANDSRLSKPGAHLILEPLYRGGSYGNLRLVLLLLVDGAGCWRRGELKKTCVAGGEDPGEPAFSNRNFTLQRMHVIHDGFRITIS